MSLRIWLLALTTTVACATASSTQATTISINPSATYLRGSGNAAVPYALADLGIAPGQTVRIDRLGDWQFYPNGPSAPYLAGVFSATDELLGGSPGIPHRVPGAIAAGDNFITDLSDYGATDIPEDFAIDGDPDPNYSVTIQVPAGAAYMFFTVLDSVFGDNKDLDGDFGASFTVVPEPTTWVLALVGLLGLGWIRRKRAPLKGSR